MSEIQLFKSDQFGEIRVTDVNGTAWFCAMDITRALGYANGKDAVSKHVDDIDKCLFQRSQIATLDNVPNRGLTFINESGVYALIFGSNLNSAKQFKRWVTSDVLPNIRQHGFYATATTVENLISDPDTAIKILTAYRDEKVARIKAEEENAILNQTIAEQAPKVLFADALTASNDSVLVRQLAKILQQNGIKMGEKAIFQWLRANGYLVTKGESYNLPSRKAMDMGLFSLKKTPILHSDGKTTVTTTVKITAKGQQYFYNKFVEYEKCSV